MAVLHDVADGVITFVTVPAPEYAKDIEDVAVLQILPVTSVCISLDSSYNPGDAMVILEPEARVTERVPLSLTVRDWTAGLVPLTFNVYEGDEPIWTTASVVSVTSVPPANTRAGMTQTARVVSVRSFFMLLISLLT